MRDYSNWHRGMAQTHVSLARWGSSPQSRTTTVLPHWKPVSQVRSKTPRLNINSTYTTTGALCDMWLRGKDVNKKQSKVKIIKRIQQNITWIKEDLTEWVQIPTALSL